jgi:diaminohydroxyphosphoribosylaminopyrimidine deaminase/5-amino-6-(5-phosphoribosylamino)uracil reductase
MAARRGRRPDRARDEAHLARCLELARRAEGRTAPNPMVGCVVVAPDGRIVGEGWHRGPGKAHAEVVALRAAGRRARGATLYVNLEPCNHHGRTPPCAPTVAASGVARVVIGMREPVPGHGGGAAVLRRAGVRVTMGVLEAASRELNRGFLTLARAGRPWFTLKAAATLDGASATARGESKWITGPAARRDGRRLRARVDAIVVGVGTVLADDPRLTARVAGGRDPIRVVLDGALRTSPDAAVLPEVGGSGARTVVVTTPGASEARARRLIARGAEVWRVPARGGHLDLAVVAARLGEHGVTTAMVEGGPTVLRGFLDAGLADELWLYLAPRALAGGRPWLGGPPIEPLAAAHGFAPIAPPVLLGDDVKLVLRPRRRR